MAETHLDTPNVKFKRRIFTKGLMLVFVPLFLETCLLLLVGWSSQQAEIALADQRNSLEQTIHANRLIAAGTVGYGYYCRYLISRDDKSREKGEHFVQIALTEFKVLLALAGNDERESAPPEKYTNWQCPKWKSSSGCVHGCRENRQKNLFANYAARAVWFFLRYEKLQTLLCNFTARTRSPLQVN